MRSVSDPDRADGAAFAALRLRVQGLERGAGRRAAGVLPFGVAALDRALPGGGLMLGAVHEVEGVGADLEHGAAGALFAAGILARLKGPVLWCLAAPDLCAAGLDLVGLDPDRVIHVEADRPGRIAALMEEGLRLPGLAGVVGEIDRLDLTQSRRLQLAAEAGGVTGLVIRRDRHRGRLVSEPTASVTRWRVAPLPSAAGSVPASELGARRWRLDLVRCRGAEPASWIVEEPDAEGRLALATDLAADRPAETAGMPRAG